MTWYDSHVRRELMEDKDRDDVVLKQEGWMEDKKVGYAVRERYVRAVQWLLQQRRHRKLKNLLSKT